MDSLEEPRAPGGRNLWILLALALAAGVMAWYAVNRPARPAAPAASPAAATPPGGTPTTGNDPAATTERPATAPAPARPLPGKSGRDADRSRPAPAPSTSAPAAREFRVTSDVPGAYVFLDRKFLGTTPFSSRDVAPGTYQLNVQTEGRPPVVRSVEVLPQGLTEVAITLAVPAATAAAATPFSASVAVVHQHAMGSCEGTLRATGDVLSYDTPHKDAFTLPYASVESLAVDYTEKRLRLKQRGGRTWNFTTRAANADPLFVFHRDVEAAHR